MSSLPYQQLGTLVVSLWLGTLTAQSWQPIGLATLSTAPDTFSVVVGSCQRFGADLSIYCTMAAEQPSFMLHLGDWTYPYYDLGPLYATDTALINLSYRRRYTEPQMATCWGQIPIAYVYDDNDYWGGNGSRHHQNLYHPKATPPLRLYSRPMPDQARANIVQGYSRNFPHPPLPDTTEGIYHSFRYGSAEFFILDRCTARRQPIEAAFHYDHRRRRWYYCPDSSYHLLGHKQMMWLQQSLLHSTATWKFIVSGVPFNKGYRRYIHQMLKYQHLRVGSVSTMALAHAFAQYWSGYPADQEALLQFIQHHQLRNIIVLSGDSHHCAIDDGTNAGLPELNASGLATGPTNLLFYLQLFNRLTMHASVRRSLWNTGGNGINNTNFKSSFGKVTVMADKGVLLEVIDQNGKRITTLHITPQ